MIDSLHPDIVAFARETTSGTGNDPACKAIKLYLAVRDGIWYDPYVPFFEPEHYRASKVLALGRGYCVSKASLLCALGRSVGIPSRLGFADVRNHLATRELITYLGSDLFVFHGYVEFLLNERWVIATPAFNEELCRRHGVIPLEFDGCQDSLFQPYNLKNQAFMEYVRYHGTFQDVPLDRILSAWKRAYGEKRVKGWIRQHKAAGGKRIRNFLAEEVVKLDGEGG
jgi:transglutaminase-like putative cysteine protease